MFHILLFIFSLLFSLLLKAIILIYKIIKFLLIHSLSRFLIIISAIGIYFNISFIYISSIYFIFLVYKVAIRLNIFHYIFISISNSIHSFTNNLSLNKKLKSINSNCIILNNLWMEKLNGYCYFQHLLICDRGIFNIKSVGDSNYHSTDININDIVIDSDYINSISDSFIDSSDILEDLLPENIPIYNIIALNNDKYVLNDHIQLTTSVVTINSITKYIEKNFSSINNINIPYIKKIVLENQEWIFYKVFVTIKNFLWSSKKIILFFICSAIIYYFYIIFISYMYYLLKFW